MKTIRLVLLSAVLAIAGSVGAKNNIIQFDSQFNAIGSTSVEPNEIIVLMGAYHPSTVLELKITTLVSNITHDVKVNLTNAAWSAQIGPFLPNQSVSLQFEVTEKLNDSDFITFRKDFETAFNSTMDWIAANRSSHPEFDKSDSLYQAFSEHFSSALPLEFQMYKNADNVPASQLLLEAMKVKQKENIFDYHKNLNAIAKNQTQFRLNGQAITDLISDPSQKNAANDYLSKMANDTIIVDTTIVVNQFLSASKMDVSSLGTKANVLEFNLKELANNHNQVVTCKKKVDNILKEFNILKTSELTCSIDNSTTLTIDIHQYLGFDIVPMAFIGDNKPGGPYGVFFTVSTYMGRVFHDEKILQPKPESENKIQKHARRSGNWMRCVTPTLGLALFNSSDSLRAKPIVFGGVGIRLNPLVRLTTGVSVFIPKGANSPKACFTFGLGIRVDYVAEVLKSFTTANSNL
jgi:hypothetical protein